MWSFEPVSVESPPPPVAHARTLAVLAPERPRKDHNAKRLMTLGVAAVLSTVLLVTAIALSRGAYLGAEARVAHPASASTQEGDLSDTPKKPILGPSKSGAALTPSAWPLLSVFAEPTPEPTARPVLKPKTPPAAPEVVRAAQAKLDDVMRKRNTRGAFSALKELLELDSSALSDAAVRRHAVELSQTLALIQGPEPAEFLNLLTNDYAPDGLDVLYEILTTRGSSRASKDAALYLADPVVRARGSAALQIAWEMRAAQSCDAKRPLLPRAASEGDHRVLSELLIAQTSCRRGGICCGWKEPEVEQTIRALKTKPQP